MTDEVNENNERKGIVTYYSEPHKPSGQTGEIWSTCTGGSRLDGAVWHEYDTEVTKTGNYEDARKTAAWLIASG